jgi:hypothetical protein
MIRTTRAARRAFEADLCSTGRAHEIRRRFLIRKKNERCLHRRLRLRPTQELGGVSVS